jgi:hypothetical protein
MQYNNYAFHERFFVKTKQHPVPEREASFLQSAIHEPPFYRLVCRIRGENPSSLPL